MGSGGTAPRINLGNRGRQGFNFTPQPLYTVRKEPPPGTGWIGEWVDPYASRGVLENNCVLRKSDSGSTIVQRVARLQEDKFYKQNTF